MLAIGVATGGGHRYSRPPMHSLFYAQFLNALKQFQANLGPILEAESPVLLFGASKAGKSTLLARLLSNDSPTEFNRKIMELEMTLAEMAKLADDVRVGGGPSSTTLVPLLKKVGVLNVIDNPGFRDMDEQRDIMISLFHKCTLSEIVRRTTPKIVLVVSAPLLHDLANFANQYHLPLRAMFGEENRDAYSSFLESTYFVLTHKDRIEAHPKTAGRSPKEVIMDQVAEITGGDDQIIKLLLRMSKKHIMMDYNQDGGPECIAKLKAKLEEESNQAGLPAVFFKDFDGKLNKANLWLEDDLKNLEEQAAIAFEAGRQRLQALASQKELQETELKYQHEKDRTQDLLDLDKLQFHSEQLREHLSSYERTQDHLEKAISAKDIPRIMRYRSHERTNPLDGHRYEFHLTLAPEHENINFIMVEPGSTLVYRDASAMQSSMIKVNDKASSVLDRQIRSDGTSEIFAAVWPDAAAVIADAGYLPLHLAYGAPLTFLKELLAAYPKGAQETNLRGKVPLHAALENKASFDVISFLHSAWPEAVQIKDRDGYLPLHYAVQHDAPLDFVKVLLTSYPRGVQEQNRGGFLPLQVALANAAPLELLLVLLLFDLPLVEDSGSLTPREHAGSWTLIMDHRNATVEHVMFLVKGVFNNLSALTAQRQLAHTIDAKGREAISICHADVRALMHTYLFFLGKFELQQGPPVHKSATAIVCYALDHSHEPPLRVALKFMKHKEQFDREISSRATSQLDGAFVLAVTQSYDGDELGQDFLQDLVRLGFSEYSYCLVLPAADRSLKDIIDKERIAGCRDVEAVRSIALQLARTLEHMHSRLIIHGDIKPLNVVRVGADIKLIDLDASTLMTEHAASKFSSAYLPPELLAQDGSVKQGQVLAHASLDMWSFGCVLFHLCAGEPLWLANDEDNIAEQHDLLLLFEWSSSSTKSRKLAKIKDKNARNIVSQLLSKEPLRRPASMTHVLAHPFFTGHIVGRSPGEEAEFNVFISYRWSANDDVVEKMYALFVSKGLKVWWDKRCLKHGVSWEAGFCDGLVKSRCFVPFLSRAAIKSQFEALTEDSICDNVLLEHRLALELAQRGLLERIFPLMIGDLDAATGAYSHYFHSGCAPSPISTAVVQKIEAKLAEHLGRQSLGAPLHDAMCVKQVFESICINLGAMVEGSEALEVILEARADEIVKMVRLIDIDGKGAVKGGGGGHASMQHVLHEARARAEAAEAAREVERAAKEVALQAHDAERLAREAAEQQIEVLRMELARFKHA